jgi:hypothetical protein
MLKKIFCCLFRKRPTEKDTLEDPDFYWFPRAHWFGITYNGHSVCRYCKGTGVAYGCSTLLECKTYTIQEIVHSAYCPTITLGNSEMSPRIHVFYECL